MSSNVARGQGHHTREIEGIVVELYNLFFEAETRPVEWEIYEITGEDEAEVAPYEMGVNYDDWRVWDAERRLEVLLHELAHLVDYDVDHCDVFWNNFVELVRETEHRIAEVEAILGAPVDTERLKRYVVESVNEHSVEPELESVQQRKAKLRNSLYSSP